MLFPVTIAVVGVAIYLVLTRGLSRLRSSNVIILAGQRLGADLKEVVEGRRQSWCLTTSLAIHILSCGSFLVLGQAIGLTGLGPLDYLKVVPAALLVTIIPFSIGGWSLRETSVIIGFGLIGVGADHAFALSVMFGMLSVIAAFVPAFAGLYWFFEKPHDELIEVFAEQVES